MADRQIKSLYKLVLFLLLVGVLFVSGCVGYEQPSTGGEQITATVEVTEEPAQTDGSEGTDIENAGSEDIVQNVMVDITSSGFDPQRVSINAGDTVTWINRQSRASWPASDIHPTHKNYPGSDIKKCSTEEESTIFDACKGLEQEESYSFTFTETGTWTYHDHFKPSMTGIIIVQ